MHVHALVRNLRRVYLRTRRRYASIGAYQMSWLMPISSLGRVASQKAVAGCSRNLYSGVDGAKRPARAKQARPAMPRRRERRTEDSGGSRLDAHRRQAALPPRGTRHTPPRGAWRRRPMVVGVQARTRPTVSGRRGLGRGAKSGTRRSQSSCRLQDRLHPFGERIDTRS